MDERYIETRQEDFRKTCLDLHKKLASPVMMFFAADESGEKGSFSLYCLFEDTAARQWVFVSTRVPAETPVYETLSRDVFSAALFEREMKETFGLSPKGSPDRRRLNLHDEVWPEGSFPLLKDFRMPAATGNTGKEYRFRKVEGEGIFEVPVGPVHAGIIGPGHFRFSAAGEPIINLELRLGFTHRGVEKLFEGRTPEECVKLAECVSGDSSFAHSLAFCNAAEKIRGIRVPRETRRLRCIFLELERLYNHAAGIGGMAVDVGFSFPNAYASLIKESLLSLNESLSGSRYLKGVNTAGGTSRSLSADNLDLLGKTLETVRKEFGELKDMLLSNGSFMDRVDGTGILEKRIAEDLGITGLAARASGIGKDLRQDFPGEYAGVDFKLMKQARGDALARLNMRIGEFEESLRLIRCFTEITREPRENDEPGDAGARTSGLGYTEAWRGPVLYWVKLDGNGAVDRCKIVDPSFHNWQGLAYAVQGNIIPDFPLCNKSFDLSYSGNDL